MFEAEGGRHYWFAQELNKHGFKVTIFCANSRYDRTGKFFDFDGVFTRKRTSKGIPFIFVKTVSYNGNGVRRLGDMLAFYHNLKVAARRLAQSQGVPDVVLASSVHPLTLLAGEQLAKEWRIPCICEIRDLWPEAFFFSGAVRKGSLLGNALQAGEHRIYKDADALIFLKPGDHEYIVENGWDLAHGGDIDMDKCWYINNGIDFSSFQKQVIDEAFDDGQLKGTDKLFVYAGTIRPTNNISALVDAAILLRDRDDIKILVYGSGSERCALEKRVAEEELTNIIFKGFVDKRKIPYILSRATGTLLHYTAKGYNWSRGNSSNKLFEYMAAGRPIISSVKMAYSPVEEFQCGISLDEGTPEEIASAIREICDMDAETYLGMCERAREGAKNYDFSELTNKLIIVINKTTYGNKE